MKRVVWLTVLLLALGSGIAAFGEFYRTVCCPQPPRPVPVQWKNQDQINHLAIYGSSLLFLLGCALVVGLLARSLLRFANDLEEDALHERINDR
jgi:hypothetical protein